MERVGTFVGSREKSNFRSNRVCCRVLKSVCRLEKAISMLRQRQEVHGRIICIQMALAQFKPFWICCLHRFIKSKGPRTEPCGTPFVTATQSDKTSSCLTVCEVLVGLWNHFIALHPIHSRLHVIKTLWIQMWLCLDMMISKNLRRYTASYHHNNTVFI